MNRNKTRDKIRAVFLAALMITSVFGGTVAFTGTVAANATGLSLSTTGDITSSSDVTFDVTDDSAANEGDIHVWIDDGDGKYEDGEHSMTISSTNSEGTTYSGKTITVPDGYAEGTYHLAAVEASSLSTGAIADQNSSATFTVDDTAPGISEFSVSNDSGAKITIKSNESLADVEVTVVENNGTTTTLTEDNFTESESAGTYTNTYTLSHGDGFYKATLNTAADDAGNDGASGETASVRIDSSDEFSNYSPTSSVSDNQTKVSVDLGTGYSDIAVTIANGDGVKYRGTPDDSGVYYIDGELIVDPAGSDVPNLPDGKVTIGVSATKGGSNSYDEWSFVVDTTGPHLTNPTLDGHSPGTKVASKEPKFTVDINDDDSSVDPFSVSVTISHNGNTVTLDDSADGVSFSGSTLTVDSAGSDVPNFTQGEVTYTVYAEDTKTNPTEKSYSFTVDTVNPTVTSATISEPMVNASNVGDTREVTLKFSEPMDNSTVPDVAIMVNGTNVVPGDGLVDANSTFGPGSNGWSADNTTWKGTVNLETTTDDVEADINVTVASSAKDLAGLPLNVSNPEGTFVYDTDGPSASTNFSASELNGTLNLTKQFDIASEDDATVTYEYNTNASGGFPAEDYQTVSSPESFDTTQFEDGNIDLKVTVVDGVGNSDTANGTVLLDNYDPSVSSTLSEGELVYGDVNISEVFTVSHTDGEPVTYEYNGSNNDSFTTIDLGTSTNVFDAKTDELDTTQLEDGTLTFRVNVTDDAGNKVSKTVNVTVNNLDVRTFEAEGLNGSDAGTAQVTFETNSNLSSLTVGVNSTDSYFGGSVTKTLTLDDFSRDYNATTGVVTYTATVDDRDGAYKATLISAVGENDQKLLNSDETSTFSIDGEDPQVTDAVIIGADDTSTTVRVEFNEPVADDLSGSEVLEVGDARAQSANIAGGNAKKGYVEVTFDSHFQTGDSPELNVSDGAFNEKFSVETQNATSSDDATTVHTLKLNLKEGHNVVSVPAASGGLDLTELDALSENDTVWAYDNGEWLSYTPGDNQSDFTTLEGGQGYIFVMNSSATIDVNVYNQPGGTDVGSSTPGTESVEEGWNLLGHWQEGSQTVKTGLSTIEEGDYGAVYGQTQNGELSFSVASNMDPGEGYWVFVTEDDGDAYGEHAYAN